jgi:hypothetical protein
MDDRIDNPSDPDEERERIRKALANVENWQQKYGGQFFGGVRMQAQGAAGVSRGHGVTIGDPDMAKKIAPRDDDVDPGNLDPGSLTELEVTQGLCWTCHEPVQQGILCEKCAARHKGGLTIQPRVQRTNVAADDGVALTSIPHPFGGLSALKSEGVPTPYDPSAPPTAWTRVPRYPWLRWLFNLISTEEPL